MTLLKSRHVKYNNVSGIQLECGQFKRILTSWSMAKHSVGNVVEIT